MCGVRLLNILMDENIKEDILEEPEVKKIKIEEITSADVGKVGDITADIPNGLSKRQLKKLKRRELWLANLPEKRWACRNNVGCWSLIKIIDGLFFPFQGQGKEQVENEEEGSKGE